jgi:hypothetical protein
MPWRKAHGASAKNGETLVWENAHEDPARPVPPGAELAIVRDAGGRVRSSEAARELARLRKNVPDFVARDIICLPEFKPYDRQRKAWTRQRVAEIHLQTGGTSRGVGTRVRASGWGVAFGEYLASKAAETGDAELMERALIVLDKAATLDEKARRLAVDEAIARPKDSQAQRKALEAAFGPREEGR